MRFFFFVDKVRALLQAVILDLDQSMDSNARITDVQNQGAQEHPFKALVPLQKMYANAPVKEKQQMWRFNLASAGGDALDEAQRFVEVHTNENDDVIMSSMKDEGDGAENGVEKKDGSF